MYDVTDRLLRKEVDDDGNGSVDRGEKFVYDGANIALAYAGAGSLTNRYLYGPAVDQVFADEDALGEILWALSDNQGTVRDLAEYDGATGTTSVANHVQYDAFGNITDESNSSVEFRHAFTGQDWDADLGMYNYGARWYDAVTALFASEDPSSFSAGDANLYRYVGNSPTNYVDPTGRTGVANGVMYGLPEGEVVATQAEWERMQAIAAQYAGISETGGGGSGPAGWAWNDLWYMAANPIDTAEGFVLGYLDGNAMVTNALTLGQNDSLNDYVNDAVERNGGLYTGAYYSSWFGAGSLYAAGGLAGAEYLGMTQLGSSAVGSELAAQAQLELWYASIYGSPFAYGAAQAQGQGQASVEAARAQVNRQAQRALEAAARAQDRRGLTNQQAGNYADRFFNRANSLYDRELARSGSSVQVVPQQSRNALGQIVNWGTAGSRRPDAAIMNRYDTREVYSIYDITYGARWNDALTTREYLRYFNPQDGVVREINPFGPR